MLEKVLMRSDAVDREALCIIAGQRVSSPERPTCSGGFIAPTIATLSELETGTNVDSLTSRYGT